MAGERKPIFIGGTDFGVKHDGTIINTEHEASDVVFEVITAIDFDTNKYKKREINCAKGIIVVGDESDWI